MQKPHGYLPTVPILRLVTPAVEKVKWGPGCTETELLELGSNLVWWLVWSKNSQNLGFSPLPKLGTVFSEPSFSCS